MGVGEGWGMGNCYGVEARNDILGGIPSVAIAGPSLRYTIGLEATTPAEECLSNIEHRFNEDADARRSVGNGSRRQGCRGYTQCRQSTTGERFHE